MHACLAAQGAHYPTVRTTRLLPGCDRRIYCRLERAISGVRSSLRSSTLAIVRPRRNVTDVVAEPLAPASVPLGRQAHCTAVTVRSTRRPAAGVQAVASRWAAPAPVLLVTCRGRRRPPTQAVVRAPRWLGRGSFATCRAAHRSRAQMAAHQGCTRCPGRRSAHCYKRRCDEFCLSPTTLLMALGPLASRTRCRTSPSLANETSSSKQILHMSSSSRYPTDHAQLRRQRAWGRWRRLGKRDDTTAARRLPQAEVQRNQASVRKCEMRA